MFDLGWILPKSDMFYSKNKTRVPIWNKAYSTLVKSTLSDRNVVKDISNTPIKFPKKKIIIVIYSSSAHSTCRSFFIKLFKMSSVLVGLFKTSRYVCATTTCPICWYLDNSSCGWENAFQVSSVMYTFTWVGIVYLVVLKWLHFKYFLFA